MRTTLCLVYGLLSNCAVWGQTFHLCPSFMVQQRVGEPTLFGPSIAVDLSDVPESFRYSVRLSRSKGEKYIPDGAFRLIDVATRFGVTAEKRVVYQDKFDLHIGLLLERVEMDRQANGEPLSWGQTFHGVGAIVGVSACATYRLGSITAVFAGLEPSYLAFTSTWVDQNLDIPQGRPLGDSALLTWTAGLSVALGNN